MKYLNVLLCVILFGGCSQDSPYSPENAPNLTKLAIVASDLRKEDAKATGQTEVGHDSLELQTASGLCLIGTLCDPKVTILSPIGYIYAASLPTAVTIKVRFEKLANADIVIKINGVEILSDENLSTNKITPKLESAISFTINTYSTYTIYAIATNNFELPWPLPSIKSSDSQTRSFFVKDPNAPPPPPSAPSIPTSVQNNNCNPKISWSPVSNATGYKIYRAFDNPGGTYGKIATISATDYTDGSQQIWSCTSIGPKESVYYKVKAYNGGGESSFSNTASGTVKEELY